MAARLIPSVLLASGLLAAGLLPGCFRPASLASERTLRIWQSGRSAGANRGTRTLTREQAVQLAIAQSPELHAARAEVEQEVGQASADTELENPELRVRDVELEKAADGTPEMQIGLRIPVPHPWMLDAQAQRGRLRVEQARAERRDLERRTRAEVEKLFARLAMLAQATRQVEEGLPLLARYRELAEQRVQEGATTSLDATVPRLRHAEATDQRLALQLERIRVERRLRYLVGAPTERELRFQVRSDDLEPARGVRLDEEVLTRRALVRRHDLRRAAARVGVAEADVFLARTRRWPWLRFLELGYHLTPNPDPRRFELAAAFELPLLSWRRGAIAAEEARLAARRLEERTRVVGAAQEVSEACARVRIGAERLAGLRRTLLPVLRAGVEAASKGVADGVLDPRRAAVALWRKVRAERRYLEAQLAAREARIDLEAAVGGGMP